MGRTERCGERVTWGAHSPACAAPGMGSNPGPGRMSPPIAALAAGVARAISRASSRRSVGAPFAPLPAASSGTAIRIGGGTCSPPARRLRARPGGCSSCAWVSSMQTIQCALPGRCASGAASSGSQAGGGLLQSRHHMQVCSRCGMCAREQQGEKGSPRSAQSQHSSAQRLSASQSPGCSSPRGGPGTPPTSGSSALGPAPVLERFPLTASAIALRPGSASTSVELAVASRTAVAVASALSGTSGLWPQHRPCRTAWILLQSPQKRLGHCSPQRFSGPEHRMSALRPLQG